MKYSKYIKFWDFDKDEVSIIEMIISGIAALILTVGIFGGVGWVLYLLAGLSEVLSYIIVLFFVTFGGLIAFAFFFYLLIGIGDIICPYIVLFFALFKCPISYPFRYMKMRHLVKSGKCFTRESAGKILACYVCKEEIDVVVQT
jgi:hypothetical protein